MKVGDKYDESKRERGYIYGVTGGIVVDVISPGEREHQQSGSVEVWTRVMGYHRPVSEFNPGKKSEHYERQHFSEHTSMKSIENMDKDKKDE